MDEAALEAEQPLRTTVNPTLAGDWALVLASAGLAHRMDQRDGRFVLVVSGRDAAAAEAALSAFDAESVPAVPAAAPDLGPSALGAAFAVGLVAMFVVAGSRDVSSPSRWFAAGSASAERIMHGQWWRVITALTLHADLLHLAGNVLACLLFVSAVGRWLGPGLGACLILLAAAAGNALTALYHRTGHLSVGASTATFAALGIIAGLQLVRRWRDEVRRRRAWLPLGAGLGLFAMLGVGEHADVLAHLFGLGCGALVGAAAALAGVRAPRWLGQLLLVVLALAVVAGAWTLALRTPAPPALP